MSQESLTSEIELSKRINELKGELTTLESDLQMLQNNSKWYEVILSAGSLGRRTIFLTQEEAQTLKTSIDAVTLPLRNTPNLGDFKFIRNILPGLALSITPVFNKNIS